MVDSTDEQDCPSERGHILVRLFEGHRSAIAAVYRTVERIMRTPDSELLATTYQKVYDEDHEVSWQARRRELIHELPQVIDQHGGVWEREVLGGQHCLRFSFNPRMVIRLVRNTSLAVQAEERQEFFKTATLENLHTLCPSAEVGLFASEAELAKQLAESWDGESVLQVFCLWGYQRDIIRFYLPAQNLTVQLAAGELLQALGSRVEATLDSVAQNQSAKPEVVAAATEDNGLRITPITHRPKADRMANVDKLPANPEINQDVNRGQQQEGTSS